MNTSFTGENIHDFVCLLSFIFCLLYLKEAYEEFKHVLLALIFHENDQASPVANEVYIILTENATDSYCIELQVIEDSIRTNMMYLGLPIYKFDVPGHEL